jgi:hypothetical protein
MGRFVYKKGWRNQSSLRSKADRDAGYGIRDRLQQARASSRIAHPASRIPKKKGLGKIPALEVLRLTVSVPGQW